MTQSPTGRPRYEFQTDDSSLWPIAAKVKAGERLSEQDGVALYRSPDLLAVGWLANLVRERLHGNLTFFNVNRHINPTNVLRCKLPTLRLWQEEGRRWNLHHGLGRSLVVSRHGLQ